MCSTPRPKRKVKAKARQVHTGILASMSSEKRHAFAEKANKASEHRIKAQQLKREQQAKVNALKISEQRLTPKKAKAKKTHLSLMEGLLGSVFVKLLNTSLTDIYQKIMLGR